MKHIVQFLENQKKNESLHNREYPNKNTMLWFCVILAQQTQTNCKIVFKLKLHCSVRWLHNYRRYCLKLLIGERTQKSDIFSLLDPIYGISQYKLVIYGLFYTTTYSTDVLCI